MPKKKQSMMPQSTAGLIRYFDDSETTIRLKPEHVIIISVLIIAVELILKFAVFV